MEGSGKVAKVTQMGHGMEESSDVDAFSKLHSAECDYSQEDEQLSDKGKTIRRTKQKDSVSSLLSSSLKHFQCCSIHGSANNIHFHKDMLGPFEGVSIVQCTSCLQFLGLLENETSFYTVEEILSPKDEMADGWHKVKTTWERRILYVLNQIVYKSHEQPDEQLMEVPFSVPPPSDLVKLLWVNKQPVGFYSMKLKGTFDVTTMSCFSMTTLDTIFIRKSHRRMGWGASAVKDLVLEFPNENIGFSYPISYSMEGILRKYLQLTPADRPRFWEITGCGTEGNIRNLWLMFQRQQKKNDALSKNNGL